MQIPRWKRGLGKKERYWNVVLPNLFNFRFKSLISDSSLGVSGLDLEGADGEGDVEEDGALQKRKREN